MAGIPHPTKPTKRISEAGRRQDRLTAKQERFCREYVVDLNAAAAARRAGYDTTTNADSVGSQVLGSTKVQVRIAALQAAKIKRLDVDSDFVLRRLLDEVNADARDLYGPDGHLLPVPQWPEVWCRGLVSQIRTTRLFDPRDRSREVGTQTDVILVDRARRLELLGKHIKVGAFAERVQLGVDTPLQELFRQIAGNVIRPAAEREPRLIEHQDEADPGALAPRQRRRSADPAPEPDETQGSDALGAWPGKGKAG